MSSTIANVRRASGLLCVLWAAAAQAGPGDHIRTGDTTITPDVDVGFEYRSNVYRAASDPTAGGNLRVAPGLELGVDNSQNSFNLAGEWEIRKYLFLLTDSPNRAEQVRAADRFNDFNVGADLEVLRTEPVGVLLSDQVTLRNNETDRGVLGNPFVTQVRNSLSGGLRISPGEALDIVPGGAWSYDDYRVASADAFRTRFNSRHSYGPTLDVRWAFFPRTSLVLNADAMWNRWSSNSVDVLDPLTGTQGAVEVPNSTHIKVQGGLKGRFTERVYLDLLAGYGTALYESAPGVSAEDEDLKGLAGLMMSVGSRYVLMRDGDKGLEAGLGFSRDFSDSFFTNYIVYNQIYGQLGADISGLEPELRYSLRFEDYGGAVTRDDVLHRLDSKLGYRFQDWGKVTAAVAWQKRGVVQQAFSSAEYDEVIVQLSSTFTY